MDSRRSFIVKAVTSVSGVSFVAAILSGMSRIARAAQQRPTPSETKGPFYPVTAQKDKDFDLTRIEGQEKTAIGRVIEVIGLVLDTGGAAIEDATVELWQANAAGRYRHPRDSNAAPLDPGFQGWAVVPSGRDGGFRFKTIFPGAYPAGPDWTRPPHIHFKIQKTGYATLFTQMYFPGEPLNDSDMLLNQKSEGDRKLMVSARTDADQETYRFNIVMKRD